MTNVLHAFLAFGKALLLVLLISSFSQAVSAQSDLQLSIGASYGVAPILNYGDRERSANMLSIFGELTYNRIIGRLQYSSPISGEIKDDENYESGAAYHGAAGYNIMLSEALNLPMMLTAGAAVITYNNGVNGGGTKFTDVSPQFGVTFAPYYSISSHVAVQGTFRYLKGLASGDRGEPIDLMDIALGVRFTL